MSCRVALAALFLLGSVSGCHGDHPRAPEVQTVEPEYVQVSKLEAPTSCTFIEMVKGAIDNNYLALRKRAGQQGANYVVLDVMETSGGGPFTWYRVRSVMVGRAYYCNAAVDLARGPERQPTNAEPSLPADDEFSLGD